MSSADSWQDQRREWVRYVETIAKDHNRRQEAKRLASRELRESRICETRLSKIVLAP